MRGPNLKESGFHLDADCERLLEQVRAGDSGARELLLDLYRDRLLGMVRARMDARLAQRVGASDIVQDATLRAAERLDAYLADPSMDFYLWLRWITRERLIDVHREHLQTVKRDARREVSLSGVAEPDASHVALAEVLVGNLTSPSNAAEREQHRRVVQQAIARLDDHDREILILRHFEQLTTSQAGAVMGLSKSGASKRHIQALRRLRSLLEEMLPDHA